MSTFFSPTRRQFLGRSFAGALAGTLGVAVSPWGRARAAEERKSQLAKSCILVFLDGGPSHIDTFDPKPGVPTGGPFTALDTKIPGVKFCQHLPKLAEQADKLAVVRSLTSKEGDHERALALLHTGYSPTPALEYPSLGAMVARERNDESSAAPSFVALDGTFGPGYLGPEFGPYVIDDPANPAVNLALPDGFAPERMQKRLEKLAAFNQGFARRTGSNRPLDFTRLSLRADRLRQSPALKAFDAAAEEPLWKDYGGELAEGSFARACILARRLVENGVRFVELKLGGWDTHNDNFNQVQTLSNILDFGLGTLVRDLAARGLLEETLIVCVGEFGRTPTINGDNGRDHWSDCFSAVLAGGSIQGGRVIGASDAAGAQVKDRPVTIPDFHATLLAAFGIHADKQYTTPDGRPIRLTDQGKAVKELF